MAIINWYKKYTETLAETLKRLRDEYPEYKDEKITYAGRLDPMAEGLLILLTGDDVHRKDELLGLSKTYEVSFFFGVSTDTYDILGIINKISEKKKSHNKFLSIIKKISNISEQEYPGYSSKVVNGKPLYTWAREHNLDTIEIPKRPVEIFGIEKLPTRIFSKEFLEKFFIENIAKVIGDFRQEEIIENWQDYFKKTNRKNFDLYTIRVSCSSGTYMRSLVHEIGERLGLGACTVRIKRIQVGNYHIESVESTYE